MWTGTAYNVAETQTVIATLLRHSDAEQQQDLAQEYLDSLGVRDDSIGLEGLDIEGFTTMWKGLGGSRTWRTNTHIPYQE